MGRRNRSHQLVSRGRYQCRLIGLKKSKRGCDLDRWNNRSRKVKSASSWNNYTPARIAYLAKQLPGIRVGEPSASLSDQTAQAPFWGRDGDELRTV